MKITESMENYLETILILSEKLPVVRSVDIAEKLDFKKSSVSVAVKKLKQQGSITVTKEGYIYLTQSGLDIATTIYERHRLISQWLMGLGVDHDIAVRDACKMEHIISTESFEAIKAHVNSHSHR